MEIFNVPNITAILPAKDGSVWLARKGGDLCNFIPHTANALALQSSAYLSLEHLEFVATPVDDEAYIQMSSNGFRYVGVSTTERYPTPKQKNYSPWLNGKLVRKWAGYSRGPAVFVSAKGRRAHALGRLLITSGAGTAQRYCSMGNHRDTPLVYAAAGMADGKVVRVPGTHDLLAVAVHMSQTTREIAIYAQIFDSSMWRFKSDQAAEYDHTMIDADDSIGVRRFVPTTIGSVIVYGGSPMNQSLEILPDLQSRLAPSWYPTGDELGAIYTEKAALRSRSRVHVTADRAAWVGPDNAVHVRSATNTDTRVFRPNGRRKVRGCAFAKDGQTLWAFDSACIFRVDVDD